MIVENSPNPYYTNSQNPFHSFWMAGYECTDKMNAFGNRVDLLTLTGHLQLLEQDYALLKDFNIKTVREGIRWSQVEKRAYQYDWSTVATMIKKGKAGGIQQVWDLCHFGYPDDLTPLHPMFARRFAALCREFVKFYRSVDAYTPLIVTPVNEVSFISWLGGEVAGTSPYCVRMGWEVKYALMRAYIEGIAALKEIDPSIRILTTEPLVQIVPPLNATPGEIEFAAFAHTNQYQAVDILSGRMCAELGGRPDNLDMLGFNFYYDNQWSTGPREILSWWNEHNDPRWKPLRNLFKEAYERYQRPIVLTETSHPGIDRPLWIEYIARECIAVLKQNIPLWGVCIYPIIDRPDWDHLAMWHNSGLWDAELAEEELPKRVLCKPYAEAFKKAQVLVAQSLEAVPVKQYGSTPLKREVIL